MKDVVPYSRDRARKGRSLGGDPAAQRFRLKEAVRQYQVCASQPSGIGKAPGIGMEHRNDQKNAVPFGQTERRGRASGHRMQKAGAMAVNNALRVTGGAAGIAHGRGRTLINLGPVKVWIGVGEEIFITERSEEHTSEL